MSGSRWSLWWRGVGSVLVLHAIGAALMLGLEPVVLGLSGSEVRIGRWQTILSVPVVAVALTLWTSLLLRRVYPLLRSQPTVAAYRAALDLPGRFLRGALLVVVLACAADFAWLTFGRGLDATLALAMDALALSESTTLLIVAYVLLRRVMRPVLVRVPPTEVEIAQTESLGAKLAIALGVLVGTFATAVGIVSVRTIDLALDRSAWVLLARDLGRLRAPAVALQAVGAPVSAIGTWLVATGAVVLAAVLGARLARALVLDVRIATGAVDALARGTADDRASAPPPAPSRMRFHELRELAEGIDQLAARFDELYHIQARGLLARSEAQHLKTQFLASMSHDLRSPLNSIIGFSELLIRGIEGPLAPAQKQALQLIHQSGEDLLRLINDILDSAKLEAGRLDVHREWTPSVEILAETIKRSREFVGDKDIDLIAELQPGLPPVHVDADRISQALLNIIANAFKFMETGTVRVRAGIGTGAPGPPGRYLRVDIADTGTGIREEDKEAIFEAFHQLDASSSRRAGGMGLGLSLARALVELHGGKVWVESRLGAGSVFTVAVPIGE